MKRIFAVLVSLTIMGIILYRVDLQELGTYLTSMDPWLLALAFALFIPQTLVSAYRWKEMIATKARIGLWESTRLILAGSTLNILLPSKMGELAKAVFLKREGKLEINRGLNLVLFERYMDLAALGVVIATGVVFSREWNYASIIGTCYAVLVIAVFPILYFVPLHRWLQHSVFERYRILQKLRSFLLDSQAYLSELKANPGHILLLILLSVSLWGLHLFQFHVVFRALHSTVDASDVYRLVPLAILFGLIPVTLAGIGTRDSAMIFLFGPHEAVPRIVGVGLFGSIRYFVPGILGLPFFHQYLTKEQVRN